jgi:hypothetical protein
MGNTEISFPFFSSITDILILSLQTQIGWFSDVFDVCFAHRHAVLVRIYFQQVDSKGLGVQGSVLWGLGSQNEEYEVISFICLHLAHKKTI